MGENTAAVALGLCFIALVTPGPSLAATALPPIRLAQELSLQQAELQRQRAALLDNQGQLTAATLLELALAAHAANDDRNQIQQTASFLGVIYTDLGDTAIGNHQLAEAQCYYRQQLADLSVGLNRFAEAQDLINAGRVAILLGPSVLGRDYILRGWRSLRGPKVQSYFSKLRLYSTVSPLCRQLS